MYDNIFFACRYGTNRDRKCLLTYCPHRRPAHYYANSFPWQAWLCYLLELHSVSVSLSDFTFWPQVGLVVEKCEAR